MIRQDVMQALDSDVAFPPPAACEGLLCFVFHSDKDS